MEGGEVVYYNSLLSSYQIANQSREGDYLSVRKNSS